MEQLHAHEVPPHDGRQQLFEITLKEAIINKFGKDQHFYACSADNMNIDELIEFLKRKRQIYAFRRWFHSRYK